MELISHHQPEEFGKVKRRHHVSIHFPESLSLASILAERCVHHQEGRGLRMIGQRPPRNYPITIKPKTASHAAQRFSWVHLPCRSPPRVSSSNKVSCFVSTCLLGEFFSKCQIRACSWGPGGGVPPFLQQLKQIVCIYSKICGHWSQTVA